MHIIETAAMMLQLEESEVERLRGRVRLAEEKTKDPHVIIIMELDLAAQLGRVNYLKAFLRAAEPSRGEGEVRTEPPQIVEGRIGEVFYQTWFCGCCGFANGKEVCPCVAGGLRHNPAEPSSIRACTVCGKCSVHCPRNHTAGASSGWETPDARL